MRKNPYITPDMTINAKYLFAFYLSLKKKEVIR